MPKGSEAVALFLHIRFAEVSVSTVTASQSQFNCLNSYKNMHWNAHMYGAHTTVYNSVGNSKRVVS